MLYVYYTLYNTIRIASKGIGKGGEILEFIDLEADGRDLLADTISELP
jgi:hypothetical protein